MAESVVRIDAARAERAAITGVVLAGGRGRRMGGADKGLVELDGRPLVARVIERLAPQVGALLVSANRNRDRYAALGHPVVCDASDAFDGPLAGVHAALGLATTPWIATAPCDSPFLPTDFVARLCAAVDGTPGAVAVARTFGRPQPVFALIRSGVRDHLGAFLAAGGRRFESWYATLDGVEVDFDDQADAFRNLNTAAELATAHAR